MLSINTNLAKIQDTALSSANKSTQRNSEFQMLIQSAKKEKFKGTGLVGQFNGDLDAYFPKDSKHKALRDVSEDEAREAVNALAQYIRKIMDFVNEEQGDTYFAYDLHRFDFMSFAPLTYGLTESFTDTLQKDIKDLQELKRNEDIASFNEKALHIHSSIKLHSLIYESYASVAAGFFNFLQGKISGIDASFVEEKIQIIMDYAANFDSDTISLDDGTVVSATYDKASNAVLTITKDNKQEIVITANFKDDLFNTLFSMFDKDYKTQQTSFNNIYEYNQTKNTNSNKENILVSLLKDTS
ncbi:hypothetical protein, partial [Campylobacter avium]|uniref:hypothetical protein n=1 Tax=Campylobacter avium TaxID=522485 RepID=UPI00248AE180